MEKAMIKKIKLLGIEIDNYTVREEMLQVEVFLNNNVLNTIENISTKMLVSAEQTPVVKECIEQLDLAIIGEKGILTAAGVTSAQRIKETKEHEFFKEFMKRVIRNHKSVYLLGSTRDKLDEFTSFLEENYDKLRVVGNYAIEECVGDVDAAINEMNASAPDIIFSVLPVPQQEQFLLENKDKMNAKIWYGLGEDYTRNLQAGNILTTIMHAIHKKSLQSKNNKYSNEN